MADLEEHVYDDPRKYFQGVHVPTGETIGDFIRWWKEQCAVWDAQPKHIKRSDPDRWANGKKGKRK